MITCIDDRLWHVQDFVTGAELDDIIQQPWLELKWIKQENQIDWPRRRILPDNPNIARVTDYIRKRLPEINQALQTNFSSCDGHWWVDMPGFTCSMHTDGHLPNSMQLFWVAPDETFGTGFYYYKNTRSLRYQFLSRPNSGYIMLNHSDEDGSQPLQWHGMFNPVPSNKYRLSSYFYFYK